MVKCSFTGEDIPAGTGHMYVKKDGTVLYFKNSKAKKAMIKRGYKARVTPWSKIFQALKVTAKSKAASSKSEAKAKK